MNVVRYRPGEAIRWLETGAASSRHSAKKKTEGILKREGERTIAKDVFQATGVLVDLGKSALGEILHRQASAAEYVLLDDQFEIVTPGRLRAVRYEAVKHIKRRGEKVTIELERGAVTIKPHAYIVSGRIKAPIGWSRDGMEVPFDVLIDEIAGRCNIEVDESG